MAHGKLTDGLVTEKQHPSWAQPKGFRWFSGPEDVMRVVLRVVLGSETWAWCGWSVVLRGTQHLSASTYAVRQPIFLELATGRHMAEITFDLPATTNQLKA